MSTSVRSLPTLAPRAVIALLAAVALAVAAVLLTGLGITASDSAGASWNKTGPSTKAGASWNKTTSTLAGASWNTVVSVKSGASWN